MKAYIGIDPGQKGCITEINCFTDNKQIIFHDIPLLPERGIDSSKTFYLLYNMKEEEHLDIFCLIEKAQPLPKQGCTSTFNYGLGYGKILSILEILEIPFEEIRPVKWKKEFSLTIPKNQKGKKAKSKDKKELSAKVAIQLYPKLKKEFYTERGKLLDGRVDSLLIATYAERKNAGNKITRSKRK